MNNNCIHKDLFELNIYIKHFSDSLDQNRTVHWKDSCRLYVPLYNATGLKAAPLDFNIFKRTEINSSATEIQVGQNYSNNFMNSNSHAMFIQLCVMYSQIVLFTNSICLAVNEKTFWISITLPNKYLRRSC